MNDYQVMQLMLRYASEEVRRAEAILNKGGRYSSGEFQAYLNFSIESLKAVVSLSRKEAKKEK